jgi:DNA-directed RNA polymerase specialized sigma24 family protein
MDDCPEAGHQLTIEHWELGLVQKVAQSVRTDDRAQLESDLMLQLPELKRKYQTHVKNWQAYLRKALRSRALNWLRGRNRRKTAAMLDLDAPIGEDESRTGADVVQPLPQPAFDQAEAFAAAWRALGPRLQEFCTVLDQERGNLSRAAKRLELHRNTARLWKRKVSGIFKSYGF